MFALTGKHEVWRLINLLQRECLICNLYTLFIELNYIITGSY